MTLITLDPPQPRVDTVVRALDGRDVRRTEYAGTAWIDGKPIVHDLAWRTPPGAPKGIRRPFVEIAFFVPDCLAYERDRLEGAVLTLATAPQGGGAVIDGVAEFVDDPSGRPTWIQVRLHAHAPWPTGISYRVVAQTAVDAAEG